MNKTGKYCITCEHLEIVCGGGNCHNDKICEKAPQNLPKQDAYLLLAEMRADLQYILSLAMDLNDEWDNDVTIEIKKLIEKVSKHFI